MMTLDLRTAEDAAALTARLRALQAPFSDQAVAVLGEISQRLLRSDEARRHPDLQALGFWLRPAGLARLRQTFRALELPGRMLVPRGLAFHVPPANVGTLFAYGWALSVMAGNANVVRLSARAAPEQGVLLSIIDHALAGTDLAACNVFVRYGHDDTISAALSRMADVRALWGGDATVDHFRGLPAKLRSVDLTFPDRFSWAALAADAVLLADEAALERLAEGLARDVFWFSQKACSSPRLLAWCGDDATCAAAAARLYPRLGELAHRFVGAGDVGAALHRRLFLHQAVLDLDVVSLEEHGPLAVLCLGRLEDAAALKGPHAGGGVLAEARFPDLAAASSVVSERDQTLVQFGFARDELEAFVRSLNGRGLDRVVPVGDALAFDAVWDGLDLLSGFSRIVTITGGHRS